MKTKPGRQQLADWLKRSDTSQASLARQLETSTTNIQRWLHGHRVPRVEFLAKLERLTGIPSASWANDNAGKAA